jgi:hypothetical protein
MSDDITWRFGSGTRDLFLVAVMALHGPAARRRGVESAMLHRAIANSGLVLEAPESCSAVGHVRNASGRRASIAGGDGKAGIANPRVVWAGRRCGPVAAVRGEPEQFATVVLMQSQPLANERERPGRDPATTSRDQPMLRVHLNQAVGRGTRVSTNCSGVNCAGNVVAADCSRPGSRRGPRQ